MFQNKKIDCIRQLLYQFNTKQQYNWAFSLPTEVVNLILEVLSKPTLYLKKEIDSFIDSIYIDRLTNEDKEKLLAVVKVEETMDKKL